MELYSRVAIQNSTKIAKMYSTSFSLGMRLLDKRCRWAIFSVYGFVRLADEIVDTFHDYDKASLLNDFKKQTYEAIENKISTNMVLHAFQLVVNQYKIGKELIEPFFESMEEDLLVGAHNTKSYKEYIYGSAEVVGLMCLKVFCNGNEQQYTALKPYAQSLGAAFQKVNFLRDIKSDFEERGRNYFPGINFNQFNDHTKIQLIQDIKNDFSYALTGIRKLPVGCRLGVYTAYIYYLKLLEKIEAKSATEITTGRIRIPNSQKLILFIKSYLIQRWRGFSY